MHYAIVKWDNDNVRWSVIHYTPNLADFERMRGLHPPSENCIHLIDYDYVKKHKLQEVLDALRKANPVVEEEDIECEE